MAIVEYNAARLRFYADKIEPLSDDDIIIIHTNNDGTFQMTKADFNRVFENVANAPCYKRSRYYHYARIPQKAMEFLVK